MKHIDFTPADDKFTIITQARKILMDRGQLESARYLAEFLFADKKDRGGKPYFGHLERVAQGIDDARIKPIGYLHDLIEDIEGWTYDDLRLIGFDDFIVDGVQAVTKTNDHVPYFDEMVRVGLTPQAIPVKKSDLTDNSNLSRLGHAPAEKDIERVHKYKLAYDYLSDVEAGKTAPGTRFGDWMHEQSPEKQDWEMLRKYSAQNPPVLNPGFTLP
ncbi:MAG TPA: hypothetical protein VIF12_03115 [Micavibrio sp.]|jgi:hypothetical protein